MSQLATIFEKIKLNFFDEISQSEEKEQYKLVFAPFSTGFTSEDFLFLDTNNASENVHKYLDELYEFSQISNTIPKSDNFWSKSSDQDDYLHNKYKTIIESLRLIDTETLSVEKLYEPPLFLLALSTIEETTRLNYESFYDLYQSTFEELEALKVKEHQPAAQVEIKLKEANLETILQEWKLKGQKEEVEEKILDIIKDEASRFILKLNEVKGKFDTALRTHPGSGSNFYLTYCMPNNLYQTDDLNFKKVKINKS